MRLGPVRRPWLCSELGGSWVPGPVRRVRPGPGTAAPPPAPTPHMGETHAPQSAVVRVRRA